MPTLPSLPTDLATRLFSRRTVVQQLSLLTVAVAAGPLAWSAAGISNAGDLGHFMSVSRFLTGRKTLDEQLGSRFFLSLSRHDPAFAANMSSLEDAIQATHAPDIDALLALGPVEKSLMDTAVSIVSAWYTGVVGSGTKAELISYADALMYEPTKDVTVVPTYGRGPLFWTEAPPAQ